MEQAHFYKSHITWTGNRGNGTTGYGAYDRSHQVAIENKPVMECSSDPAFRGDPGKFNPEDLFLASLAACHMLWYLHLCADEGIVVVAYEDHATGTMQQASQGMRFTEVILHPRVTVTDSAMIDKANSLHIEANRRCFIANSCNFPIQHSPYCEVSIGPDSSNKNTHEISRD